MRFPFSQHIIIPPEYHGQRVDLVLAKLLPDYSRSQLSYWLKLGAITLNKKPCKPKEKVFNGDAVDIKLNYLESVKDTLPEAMPLAIIYEDEYLLVINKPAGLIVHPGAGHHEHTLVNGLLHHAPQLTTLPRAGIIHRLDKETTGLLVIAKTLASHTKLIRQMQAREIERQYIALVQGYLISGGKIHTHYGRHPRNRLKMAVCKQGREAITHYTIRKHYPNFTLLNVQLLTGRTHQIRVHMAYINHPLVGDPLYGGRKRFPAQAPEELREILQKFSRQALHAASLTFNHPATGENLTFVAPLPDDFQLLLQALDNSLE